MILNKEDYRQYLAADRKALGIKLNKGVMSFLKELFFPNKIWKFEKLLRKIEYYENVELKQNNIFRRVLGRGFYFYYRLCFRKLSLRLGFSIPPNVFGPGLSIAHYGTIIVNEAAQVGAFCRLHACVNIGASNGSLKAPQIGDNVYIGPSVVIFGDIHIASNVTIGANATVNKDCLNEHIVLAGTPARIVKENVENWVVFNRIV